jgi:hypothetical protein
MAYYTTYNTILNSMEDGGSEYVKLLEDGLTGNRWDWGLDTPIYMTDVLDRGMLSEFGELLDFCVQDTSVVKNLIALDLVSENLGVWNEQVPGDDKLAGLIVFSYLYLDFVAESLVDYCGDPIAGGELSSDAIVARCAEIEAEYGSWSYVGEPPGVYTWKRVGLVARGNDSGEAGLGTSWWYLDGCMVDYYKDSMYALGAGGAGLTFVEADLDDMVGSEFYFDQSEYIRAMSSVGGTLYQRVLVLPREVTVSDKLAQAARYIAQAAVLASKIVIGEAQSLSTVLLLVRRSLESYQRYEQSLVSAAFARWNELGAMVMPEIAAPVGSSQYEIEKSVVEAINARRWALLHDEVFIRSFDADVNGKLNGEERITMELAVGAAMAEVARTETAGLVSYYEGEGDLFSLVDVVKRYLM